MDEFVAQVKQTRLHWNILHNKFDNVILNIDNNWRQKWIFFLAYKS